MKSRFTTIDICAVVTDLQRFIGMRVNNIYDIDNKTYLIRLAKPDQKVVILIESGLRFHSTEFEWPKNMYPSGFAMKMRKHISGKRLVKLSMLGIDRILDFQFGSNEAAYHLIVELYDRGNIMLTDFEYTILNLLRTRTDSEDVRFAVKERYPIESARQLEPMMTSDELSEILLNAKVDSILKKILNPLFVFGPALLEHCLTEAGFVSNAKIGKDVNIVEDISRIMEALVNAEKKLEYARTKPCQGFIIQKREKKPGCENDNTHNELLTYQEFHPFLFKQHEEQPNLEFQSFNKAVDEFFSKLESQKLDTKALQQEKAALKKLDNVKKDHEKRLDSLQKAQEQDKEKARLIEINLPLVDQAIKVVNSAIANQIDWIEINNLVKEARARGDHVAMAIKQLKLETNHITMILKEPDVADDDSESEKEQSKNKKPNAESVDIDLGLTAYANARRYYTKKRQAATKEQKTVEASKKALKSAEKKTKETLKEVATTTSIKKARKVYWFEKFFWFISSENYLVIGGRDQQQNELIVKKHLKPGDVYVHADLHGASSIVIKNSGAGAIPPKTLNEAGCMATCYSIAWNERVVTSAWWVFDHQVSKTAPTGEYLTTGSFMIRGKKNFLPPSYLVLGFGFLFRLDETCIAKHVGERKVKTLEEENSTFDISSPETEEHEVVDGSDSEDSEGEQGIKEDNEDQTVDGDVDCNGQGLLVDEQEQTGDHNSTHEDTTEDSIGVQDQEEHDGHSGTKEDVDDDDEEIPNMSYPDTSIDLQYTSGGKYQFQRGTSYTSSQADDDLVDLGDGEVIDVRSLGIAEADRKQRLSAKQRRQMKKKGTLTETPAGSDELIPKSPELDSGKVKQPEMTPGPAKRGKKGKLKKIKEKYGDQDEEDRELMMRILGSAGAPKESKGRRKAKDAKGRKGNQPGEQRAVVDKKVNNVINSNNNKKTVNNEHTHNKNDISQTTTVDGGAPNTEGQTDDVISADDVTAADVKGDPEESKDNLPLLDSLTGCPFDDDVTLFAIPVCAPYGAVQNYKYRVKLTPGTGRRGKAARTALHSFIQSKQATGREKDLLKSVKDADLSRYIPGKVKISAAKLKK